MNGSSICVDPNSVLIFLEFQMLLANVAQMHVLN